MIELLESVAQIASELAFTPIPVNAAILGGSVAALVILRRVKSRLFTSREMADLIPHYGRKIAKQIIKARRAAGHRHVPYYHNEPWEM
ncbi:hypothetical protein LMG26689_01352 [Achromobacter animicus]|uniref:hypothetical protein n=1 Tax=Achromobacter animicus TaxID=1389935 RepID=UPI001465346C|nr:hypothetical protein [Achromobacter animicus]CAB3838695.1 hypothetical protein LMG26689_01352 [Achromobacter animicus]